jgi:alginate O-acetyltransferase complex protein AlgI
MLFTSPVFLFCFLPATLGGFFALRRLGSNELCVLWLLLASCVFYAWWSASFLIVLLISMTMNYLFGLVIEVSTGARRKALFVLAIFGNLALLGYFKYADFFIRIVNDVGGAEHPLLHIALPLGISFFTFQKIAYVTDIYVGKAKSGRYFDFALFVFFFPQLIAGPIVHHAEVMPQFSRLGGAKAPGREETWENLAVGFALLVIGLMKKALIADQIAPYSTGAFAAAHGGPAGFALAWQAALCYTTQLYFDFSGYSDMAIGLARLFGVALPVNFNSPYAALSITDFWRRWHMTLSRFLRDYVYIPLGGNRRGETRRNVNLMATMLLGGLWHGANYTFVLWGGLQGAYLFAAHRWSERKRPLPKAAAFVLTLLAVVVGWVFFRAETVRDAANILAGMSGVRGFGAEGAMPGAIIAALALIGLCALAPNSQQLLRNYRPALYAELAAPKFPRLVFSPNLAWAIFIGAGTVVVELFSWKTSEFLYFQF